MPSCTPGDIQQINYTTDELNKSIEQTIINAGRTVESDRRLTVVETEVAKNTLALSNSGDLSQISVNKSDIAKNKADIAEINGSSAGGINSRITKNEGDIAVLNTGLLAVDTKATDSYNLSQTNKTDIATNKSKTAAVTLRVTANENNISGLATVYAKIGGSSASPFKVGPAMADDDAISKVYAKSLYAAVGGDDAISFKVGNPAGGTSAVSQDWIQNTYKTSAEIQAMIDTSIALHTANASAHHTKT